jgi:hypothetical protein
LTLSDNCHYEGAIEQKVDCVISDLVLIEKFAGPFEKVVLIKAVVLSKLDYWRRLLANRPAEVANMEYGRFDDYVVGVLERKMEGAGWKDSTSVMAQLRLPAKLGGMGFRKLRGTASAACIASMVAAYAYDKTLGAELLCIARKGF